MSSSDAININKDEYIYMSRYLSKYTDTRTNVKIKLLISSIKRTSLMTSEKVHPCWE